MCSGEMGMVLSPGQSECRCESQKIHQAVNRVPPTFTPALTFQLVASFREWQVGLRLLTYLLVGACYFNSILTHLQ